MKQKASIFKGYSPKQERLLMRGMFTFVCVTLVIVMLFTIILVASLITSAEEEENINNVNIVTKQEEAPKPKLSAKGPGKVYYYSLTQKEKIMMAKLVWAEARGECYEGKVAVAAVVLNRYRFEENEWDFKNDSIESIILQKNQFASISNVTMQDLEEYPDCMKAVEAACKGYDPTRSTFKDGALYFYDPDEVNGKQKEIREGIKVMPIGGHNFHVDFEKS